MKGEEIDIDFFADFKDLDESEHSIRKFVSGFVDKYGERKEMYEISVYIKKFEGNYIGRPLIFCNITVNTEFGIITCTGTAWGLKPALKQTLRTMILELEKQREKSLYGEYNEMPDETLV